MKVIGLLNEIYNGNFDRLPERIKVNNKIFYKNNGAKDYFSEKPEKVGFSLLTNTGINREELLKSEVEEVKEVKESKWKPIIKGTSYFYVDEEGEISTDQWVDDGIYNYRYYTGNCFRTEYEAKQHLKNIKTGIELRRLAEKLNKGEKVDWNNKYQDKNYLVFDYYDEKIKEAWSNVLKRSRTIYCLSEGFKDEAIKQIGKERLKNYLVEE